MSKRTVTVVTEAMTMVSHYAAHERICLDMKDEAGWRYWRNLRNQAEKDVK